jgi:hypothetical protein
MIHVSGKKYKTKISLLSGQLVTVIGCIGYPFVESSTSRFQLGASVLQEEGEALSI